MSEVTAEQLQSLQQQLDDLATPDREWVATGLKQLGKLGLADRARKLADNQRLLNTSNATDRAYKSLGLETARWNFDRVKKAAGSSSEPAGEDPVATSNGKTDGIDFPEDEMKILIDSPTTINQHFPPEPSPQQPAVSQPTQTTTVIPPIAKTSLGSLATAALLASGMGGGALGTYLLTRPTTPTTVVTPADRMDKDFLLNLMPPDPKKVP